MIEGKPITSQHRTSNPFTILLEISQACYLDTVMFGKPDSGQRLQVSELIEQTSRISGQELVQFIENHMENRMFMTGLSISAADVVVFARTAKHFSTLTDLEKLQVPNAFRWVDHVQHLPGLLEQVHAKQLFTTFPDENQEAPSKAQLKKMAKLQAAKDAKAAKTETKKDAKPTENKDKKPEETKQNQPTGDNSTEQKQPEEKKQKPKQQTQKQQAPKVVEPSVSDIGQMDIRVGKIVKVWKHPESEKLYCEEIELANGEIRKIASGLQQYVTLERMTNAMCVVLCNLKAKKLAGYESHGMVLCAETPDKSAVELIVPPQGSLPGDLIYFEGEQRQPPETLNVKKNPWDNVQPQLKIDANGVACWQDVPFKTSKGICKSETIKNGVIH